MAQVRIRKEQMDPVSTTDVIGSFLGGLTTVVPASTTWYSSPFKSPPDTSSNQVPWPEGGVLSNMALRTATAQPASGSLVATLLVNFVATSVVITIPANGASGTWNDDVNTATLVANDTIVWRFVNNATGNSAALTAITMKLTKDST